MKNKKEAERAEQQRIKSLVLNYDLQDADQDGIDQLFDFALQPNTNHNPLLNRVRPDARTPDAHDSLQGYGGDKHEFNPSLRQSANHAGSKSSDKPGSHRAPQRSRKLQLSDVNWYVSPARPSKGTRLCFGLTVWLRKQDVTFEIAACMAGCLYGSSITCSDNANGHDSLPQAGLSPRR